MLDQEMETCKEHAYVGTTATNNSLEGTSGVTDGGTLMITVVTTSILYNQPTLDKFHIQNGQLDQGITTRRKEPLDYRKMVGLIRESCFISKMVPKNMDAALKDERWNIG
ncbi:hypothetical protein LIER_12476 [Lithospermum erythrorhizon]|uniref:Uncharacterized protein n=1 Tax=Lithospermum erythrorhizon TaxID=34254 RepID=A0AAV3PWB6_LITER